MEKNSSNSLKTFNESPKMTDFKGKGITKQFVIGKDNLGLLSRQLFKRILEISSNDQNYTTIIEDCIKRGIQYVDLSFPPNYLSLIKGMSSPGDDSQNNVNNVIAPSQTNFYSNLKSPNHKVNRNHGNTTYESNIKDDADDNLIKTDSNLRGHMSFDHHLLNLSSGRIESKDIPNAVIQSSLTQTSIIMRQWSKIQWIRASELTSKLLIFPSGFENLSSLISNSEIKQGILKNSCILSAIATIAEKPDYIMKLFNSTKSNNQSAYEIKLCYNGEWCSFIVDDYLPCDSKKRSLCFSSCVKADDRGNSGITYYWLSILEKALAKAYGSYYLLEKVSIEDALKNLTGAPVFTLENSHEDLWNEIKTALGIGYAVIASSGETLGSKELLREVGLMPFNSYNVLDAYEVDIDDVNKEYLLKIRNHWGSIEWTGDWSQFSNHWRDEIKKKLSYDEDKDSTFWMNFKDFKHYFSKFHICSLEDASNYESIKIIQERDSYNLIHLTIAGKNSDKIKCVITLTHQDRSYRQDSSGVMLSRFILCKINSFETKSLTYFEGLLGKEKTLTKEYFLPPGNYLIFTEVDWDESAGTSPFVISCYSKQACNLRFLKNDDWPSILERIYTSAAIQNEVKQTFEDEGAANCFKSSKVTPEGYAYIYFQNKEEDSTLIEDVKYTKFEGLKLLPPYSGTSYFIQVEPFTEKIILMKQLTANDFSLFYSFQ